MITDSKLVYFDKMLTCWVQEITRDRIEKFPDPWPHILPIQTYSKYCGKVSIRSWNRSFSDL